MIPVTLTEEEATALRIAIDDATTQAEEHGNWDHVAILSALYERATGLPVER